ncbi:MAG: type II toxin-antitoxin system prevent-host-death family antitoxin [Chloroflexi bacterium]|nr:type II toxin-antitoxin system prevent-host-death family antitoxin [Chloroflexota bacterium]
MARVGVRELKTRLSYYLARVKEGESVTITERGTPVAIILPSGEGRTRQAMMELVRQGLATWNGGKPKGSPNPVPVTGKPVSEIVLEDRR